MVSHEDIDPNRLLDEIELLEKAGKNIRFIIPTLIKNGQMFDIVVRYRILFEDKNK